MLKLYHFSTSVCSQKVRLCLAEKGVKWESVHIDLGKYDNFQPWYTKLNPKAVVPTLEHDGRILIESNVILEYLEDLIPQVPLRPRDAYDRAQMRLWVFNSEEMGHVNINVCSYNPRHAARMKARKQDPQELLKLADACPNPAIGRRMRKRLAEGVSAEDEDEAYSKLEFMLDLMEEKLSRTAYLAGETYSLADIAMAPLINRLELLPRAEIVSAAERPKVAAWFAKIKARPAFTEAFSFVNPDPLETVKQ